MALQQENQESVQRRNNDHLLGSPFDSVTAEPGEATAQAALSELEEAEQALKAAHNRLGRLRWELARAREREQS